MAECPMDTYSNSFAAQQASLLEEIIEISIMLEQVMNLLFVLLTFVQ